MSPSPRASHRLSGSIEDVYRRRPHRSKPKDSEKTFLLQTISEKTWKSRSSLLRLVLFAIIAGTIVTLVYSPDIHRNNPSSPSPVRQSFVKKWIWSGPDPRYVSDLVINWDDVSKTVAGLHLDTDHRGIGLLNFDADEVKKWDEIAPDAPHIVLNLESTDESVTWQSLYPEWIDEDEDETVPVCPSLPELRSPARRLGLIAANLPCQRGGNCSRDVARLHIQLAVARLVGASRGPSPPHVLLVSECFPAPNLFTCRDLVAREGHAWLYRPDVDALREKARLPVGSCELSLPLSSKAMASTGNAQREAYATILHSAHVYVCGAIAAAQSIRMSGSNRDLVILVDATISRYHRSGLEAAGWKVKPIERIRNPRAARDAYNEWNYSKFRLWQLTEYDKIIFLDADLLVLRNIDFLFSTPEISATGNNGTLFNSGLMVIEPSECTFRLLMQHIDEIESYNGGDQGYLNEVFTWWHRIPRRVNFLKNFWAGDSDVVRATKTELFAAEPPVLHVLHYLGLKPWLCFRDYDCNWNVDFLQEFASDAAHERWWRVHDAMPELLHQFCLLPSKQKAQLEWDRRQAEAANFSDGHWRVKVKDRRLRKCVDGLCNWKNMLSHWGETNWTDTDRSFVPTPPAIPATGGFS